MKECPCDAIFLTGNPVIDAVQRTVEGIVNGKLPVPKWPWLDPSKKLILVTAHRRESFGQPFESICRALAAIARRADVQVVYPVHPNPNVRAITDACFGSRPASFCWIPSAMFPLSI